MRLLLLIVLVAPCVAQDSRRIQPTGKPGRKALVIGNTKYKVSPLRNPANDAADMTSALRTLGFQVSVLTDASRQQMHDAALNFAKNLQSGDIGLFYYAGHGVQIDSENYLVPIEFTADGQAEAKAGAVPFSLIKSAIEKSHARLAIMILDSCRNNPFAKEADVRGLAMLEAGLGSYIALAASPGQTASENAGSRNGLFTTHLLRVLQEPLNIADLFRRVRQDVFTASNRQQLPYIHDQVIADFYIRTPPADKPAAATPVATASEAAVDSMLGQGRELFGQGRCDEALRIFDQVVRRDPQNAYARNAAGITYMCLNMAKPALEQFSRAIQLKPDYGTAYLNRGRLFLSSGQYELAIDDFDWAIEQEPENAVLWWRRGRALFGLRRYEDAGLQFAKAIELDRANPYSYHGRGQVYYQRGKYREALEDFSAAISRKRDFAEAYRDRSRTRDRLGDQAGAQTDMALAERYSRPPVPH